MRPLYFKKQGGGMSPSPPTDGLGTQGPGLRLEQLLYSIFAERGGVAVLSLSVTRISFTRLLSFPSNLHPLSQIQQRCLDDRTHTQEKDV